MSEGKQTKIPWKDDPLREVLKKDIMQGRITPDMKPADAAKVNAEYAKMDSKLFTSRLKGLRTSITKEPKKAKEPKWDKKNPVKQQLKLDVKEGAIPSDMDYETAHRRRAIYESMDFGKFKSRLDSMRAIAVEATRRANEDSMALEADLLQHPRATTNARGEPEWEHHAAKEQLEVDIDRGFHKGKKPQEIWESNPLYKEFGPKKFRNHIYQALRTRKWRDQWVDGKKQYTLVTSSS